MSRLIDADYAQKELTIAEVEVKKNFETDCDHVRDFLNALPTVDAVFVVRCRECKHHHDCGTHFCDALGMDCPDDSEFFCAYGVRKEGVDNG